MANLGSLYFDILLRDKTAQERAKIKKDLINDLKLKLDLDVGSQSMAKKVRDDLKTYVEGYQFKLNVVVDKATATQAVQQALSQVRTWNGKYTEDDLRAEKGKTHQAIQQWREAQAELARVKAAHLSAADAAKTHATASINLGNAMGNNITIAGRLGSAMASLYSLNMAKNFLANVIDIGGELEHQKIAMDTIFGDKGKTLDLFGNIKDLARNSPFGVMELTKSVKALSAYGVEYNEIYETAKRLADISAATSVDINRLILAFGKTKSRTFLDGLEAKQFAYANIPIYDMLSKKLTELEGKFVSVKDVMGRIKKREIGFDMVKEVLWDLTDEGGKFYNMQEALAGSVKTSWKLVKDNIELMYGELAESLAGPLKGTAEILQGLTRNWKTVSVVLGTAAAMLGIYRLSTVATNMVIGKNTALKYQNIIAEKAKYVEDLKAWRITQKLDVAEKTQIANVNKLTLAEFKLALANERLNVTDVVRLGTMGKLTKAQIRYAANIGLLSDAQAKAITNGRLLGMNMGVFGNKLKTLGYALKDFAKSIVYFLVNPWTVAMMALSGLVMLWQEHSQQMEKAKEIGDGIFTKATESAKSLHDVLSKIGEDFSKMSNFELQQVIENLENAIKDYSPNADKTIIHSQVDEKGNTRSQKERAEILRQEVEYLEQAAKWQEKWNTGAMVTNAINSAKSGLFDDNLTEDLEDYANAYNSAEQALTNYLTKHADQAKAMLAVALQADSTFAQQAASLTTWQEKFALLTKNSEKYSAAWAKIGMNWNNNVRNGVWEYNDAGQLEYKDLFYLHGNWAGESGKLKPAKKEALKEFKQVLTELKTAMEAAGVDFSKELPAHIKIALSNILPTLFDNTGFEKLAQDRQDEFKDVFRQMFNLDFDDSVLTSSMREQMEANLDTLGKDIAEKIRSGKELTDAEKEKVKEVMKTMIPIIEKEFPHLAGKLQTLIDNQQWVGEILLTFNRDAGLDDWKKALMDIWGGENPEIKAVIKSAPDVLAAYEALAELKKEVDEWINKFGTLKLPVGVTFQPGKLISDADIEKITDPATKQAAKDYNAKMETLQSLLDGQKDSGVNLTNFEKNKTKDKGSKKDKFLEGLKERFNVLKKAIDEYKKWSDLVGKEDALAKVKESGIFSALFPENGEPANLDDYKGELKKLLDQIEKQANTKERREFVINLKTLLNLDIPRDEIKEKVDNLKDQLEAEIKDVNKRWNLYNQIVNAGGSKLQASQIAFKEDTAPFEKEAQNLAAVVQKQLKAEGFELPFSMSIEDATKILGKTDNPFHKALLKAWTEAKDAMEKDEIEVKIKEIEVVNKYKSSEQKIADLTEKYIPLTGLTEEELNTMPEPKDGMSDVQIAYLTEYKEKVAEIQGELLTLLPVWGQIFGDHTYQSYGQLEEAADVARQIAANAKVQKNADGKPTIYTSSFTGKDGKKVDITGQYSQLEKVRKAIDDLYKEGEKKNPFLSLKKVISEIFNPKDTKDKESIERFAMLGQAAADSAQMIGSFANQMSEMFTALGNEGAANTMDTVGQAMNSIANIGQAFAKGGLIGGIAAAAGEAVGWITSIFQAHDKKLQKQIEKSELASKQIQNIYDAIERRLEYHLGSGKTLKLVEYDEDVRNLNALNAKINDIKAKGVIDIIDLMELQKASKEVNKLNARMKAYEEGGAYGYQRQLLKEQLAELETQRQAELDKKNSDQGAVDDYDAEIAEMRDQIRQFAEDTAKDLYGIDLKGWAQQLGDALFEAWKKGEDGAEAFKKTVANIMGDVMNSILKISILEPAMEDLRTMLFGTDGENGMFGKDSELDNNELMQIGDYLMGLSNKSEDYYQMLDKLNDYMESKYGVTMKDSDSESGGLSKGIQSVTENTADLLASYINAIRADVSMKREYIRMLVEDLFPRYSLIAEAQLRQLEQIAINTGRNASAAEEIIEILNSNIKPGTGFKIA